jgi:hypothetical protein
MFGPVEFEGDAVGAALDGQVIDTAERTRAVPWPKIIWTLAWIRCVGAPADLREDPKQSTLIPNPSKYLELMLEFQTLG